MHCGTCPIPCNRHHKCWRMNCSASWWKKGQSLNVVLAHRRLDLVRLLHLRKTHLHIFCPNCEGSSFLPGLKPGIFGLLFPQIPEVGLKEFSVENCRNKCGNRFWNRMYMFLVSMSGITFHSVSTSLCSVTIVNSRFRIPN